jgi:hypothetical protein
MRLEVSHWFLSMAPDFAKARGHALRFLERTQLVRYDAVQVVETESCSGADQRFWPLLEQGLADNREVLGKLLGELRSAGIRELNDILSLPQGFQSKIFHTMAHLLDGFFGIDSRLYILPEDSHWASDGLRRQITATPEDFWLIKTVGELASLEQASVFRLRRFEK